MDNNKQGELVDKQTYMNEAVDLMFTTIQASRGFNIFVERSVAAMVKGLK